MTNKGKHHDNLYSRPSDMLVDFVFDEQVANVFPDMIRRSVPGYDTIIPMLGVFAQKYIQPGSNIYDLGCSLGAATLSIRRRTQKENCRIIAIDNAEAMVERCRQNITSDDSTTPVDVLCQDVLDAEINNASLVVVNFTLQFLPLDTRNHVLSTIYSGLNNGGALVLSEKVTSDDQTRQNFEEDLHAEFKKANGYSELEISQKRTALENVLVPETQRQHMQRLEQTGFGFVTTWFQCFNFMSFCAVKS